MGQPRPQPDRACPERQLGRSGSYSPLIAKRRLCGNGPDPDIWSSRNQYLLPSRKPKFKVKHYLTLRKVASSVKP